MSEPAFWFVKSDDDVGSQARLREQQAQKELREQQAQQSSVGPSKYELQGPTV